MRTTWRVKRVTMTSGRTVAELLRVVWFKPNPAYAEVSAAFEEVAATRGEEVADDEFFARDWPEEFLDAEPEEPTALFTEYVSETIVIDITDGLALAPDDNVIVTLDALVGVPL